MNKVITSMLARKDICERGGADDARTSRIVKRVLWSGTLLFCAFGGSTARAADIVAVVSEATLASAAAATAQPSGSGVYFYCPTTDPVTGAAAAGQAVSPALSAPVVIPPCSPFTRVPWFWKFEGPGFSITRDGALLTGQLTVRLGLVTALQLVKLPVIVTLIGSDELSVQVADGPVPVFFDIAGRKTQIGSVQLGRFFAVRLRFAPRSFSVAGKNVTGSVGNLNMQFAPGAILLSGDLRIQ
jgi:hypothetical protein